MGFPGEPQPQKPLLPGRTSSSFTFLPNKRSRGSQRAPGMQRCGNTRDLQTPREEKQGAKSHHLPASPGRKVFTSQHCHLYKPPPFPASLQRHLCFSQQQKRAGERADRKLRAELSWKDPTCLARGLLSTGNNCHVSFELHKLSQAVVSTFLATFHQHT